MSCIWNSWANSFHHSISIRVELEVDHLGIRNETRKGIEGIEKNE